MRRVLIALLFGATLSSCAALATRERDAAVTLHYGQVEMIDDDDWRGADDQTVGAVSVEWPMGSDGESAWSHELGAAYYDAKTSPGMNAKFETQTTELTVGARRSFGTWWRSIHPYAGLGGALLYTEQEFQPAIGSPRDSEDWNGGLYLSTGFWGLLGDDLRIGTEFRVLVEEPFDSGGPDLDSTRLTLTLGYGF